MMKNKKLRARMPSGSHLIRRPFVTMLKDNTIGNRAATRGMTRILVLLELLE